MRYLKAFFPHVTFTPLSEVDTIASHLDKLKLQGVTEVTWVGGKLKEESETAMKFRHYMSGKTGIVMKYVTIPEQPANSYDMRQAAKLLDLRTFSALSAGGVSQYTINSLYKDVRAGMQNPTPVVKTTTDLIKVALGFKNSVYFKPVSKFNDMEMQNFRKVVLTDGTQLAAETTELLDTEGTNDTIDYAIRQVIRTFHNWLRFYQFATHQNMDANTVTPTGMSLHVMRNVAAKESDTTMYEYVESDVHYNSVDLRVSKIYSFVPTLVVANEFSNTPRPKLEIAFDKDDHATLNVGSYEIQMSSQVKVGSTECGWVVVHPNLSKNGFFLSTSVSFTECQTI
jgi:hypothetical protein